MHDIENGYNHLPDPSDSFQRERLELFARINSLQEKNAFPSDCDLISFMDFFREKDGRYAIHPYILLDGYLHWKKEQFADVYGNAVNFFANVARESTEILTSNNDVFVDFNSEKTQHAFDTVVGNLRSTVAEVPLAELVKTEQRIQQWEILPAGQWRLKLGNTYLDTVLADAITTSQIKAFEYPRYIVNQENYEQLCQSRMHGDYRTYVEYSPSPPPSVEATKRGYLGNSCIFFYDFDPTTGEEIVTQRWIRANWDEFMAHIMQMPQQRVDKKPLNELCERYGIDINQVTDDVRIMHASKLYDAETVFQLHAFIDSKNGEITKKSDEIMAYVHTDLHNFVERETRQMLQDGAHKLIEGNHIDKEMQQLIETLTYAQLRLRQKIERLTGMRSLTTGTIRSLAAMESEYDNLYEQLDYDATARAAFMEQHGDKLQLVGCGVNISKQIGQQLYSGGGMVFGGASMGQVIFMGGNENGWAEDDKGSLEFECPDCGWINKRKRGKLLPKCQHCGSGIVGCDDVSQFEGSEIEMIV